MFASGGTNQSQKLTLGEYVSRLIETLGKTDLASLVRMRQIVGERQAHLVLDAEGIDIWFEETGLNVQSTKKSDLHSIGETDSSTIFALLDGYLEVTDAVLRGRLYVTGSSDDINRIFLAIEILLDASPRVPELQELARRFTRERHDQRKSSLPEQADMIWYPFKVKEQELRLLNRLGLLP